MSKLTIPEGYRSPLSLYETQQAIEKVKRIFENGLGNTLNLTRVSAPLFVLPETGLNDDLNGVERAVGFDIRENGKTAQVVHSLAKWKRMALYKYGFSAGEGIYTDMNAIRRDEEMDNLHSIYVDQWDWEKIIEVSERNTDTLKNTVVKIVASICDTLDELKKIYPEIKLELSREVSFVTTQELEDMYPGYSKSKREDEYLKIHKTAFIMEIGDLLKSGEKHDGRAPDYDDWSLNGDIVFWNELLGCAFEVSSMGIRVDSKTLDSQLKKAGCEERKEMEFHKMLLDGTLPQTMGGGIGQSRLCMLLLEKAHIGEVQVSVWDDKTIRGCEENGIKLL